MTKISVIGAGFVGSTSTYALMLKEVADEIALIDINSELVAAEVADINQGFSFLSKTHIKAGTYADCADSDLIIITAGSGRKVGESRLDLLNKNIKIMEGIVAQINQTDTKAFVLVVSNPVDVLTYHVSKMITAPVKGVFGQRLRFGQLALNQRACQSLWRKDRKYQRVCYRRARRFANC